MSYLKTIIDRLENHAEKYGKPLGYNPKSSTKDKHDAFRHAFVSAVITKKLGHVLTSFLGHLYEVEGFVVDGQPATERNMDHWNNAKGRLIGRTASTYTDIAKQVDQAIKAGELITDLKDKRNYYHTLVPTLVGRGLRPAKKPLPYPRSTPTK